MKETDEEIHHKTGRYRDIRSPITFSHCTKYYKFLVLGEKIKINIKISEILNLGGNSAVNFK